MKNRTDKLISLGESLAPKYDDTPEAKFLRIGEAESQKISISEHLNEIKEFVENNKSDLGLLNAKLALIVQELKKIS